MIKHTLKNSTIIIYVFIVTICTIFTSCNKDENNIRSESLTPTNGKTKHIPFFELAKGDTISKNIYREKPNFINSDVKILYSTEFDSKLKATGYTINFGSGYINNLYVSIRRKNTVGEYLWDGLRKIPVDLNEGAGGKWIYLFCSKGYTGQEFEYCYDLRVASSSGGTIIEDINHGEYSVNDESNNRADLNDGAGGPYIHLYRRKNGYYGGILKIWGPSPIKDILIASGNASTITIQGWTKVSGDLNEGAGGKFIYIFYKR